MWRLAVLCLGFVSGCSARGCSPGSPDSRDETKSAEVGTKPPVATVAIDAARVVSIPARVRPPRTLIVLLHGVGADAHDLRSIAEHWSTALADADVLLPNGIEPFDGGGNGRQWFSIRSVSDLNRGERVRAASSAVAAWIDRCLVERGLPPSRLVIAGFSQGAVLSTWLGVHRAPAAVVSFSGRYAEDDPAAKAYGTPILITHGSADRVIPVAYAEDAARDLRVRGAKVELFIEPGVGHTISAAALEKSTTFLRALPP